MNENNDTEISPVEIKPPSLSDLEEMSLDLDGIDQTLAELDSGGPEAPNQG